MSPILPPIQEEIELKPGRLLNPIEPLWLGEEPQTGTLAWRLYQKGRSVDNYGNEHDWIGDIEEKTQEIEDSLFSWYEIGLKAWKIKLCLAWRNIAKSFRQFCEDYLGVTASAINNKIRATRVVSQLISLGFQRLPQSQSVAHELCSLPLSLLDLTWQKIIELYQDHEITLEKVKAMIPGTPKEPETRSMRISVDLYESLREFAARAQQSPTRFLNGLISHYIGQNNDDDRISAPEEDQSSSQGSGLEGGNKEGRDYPPETISHEAEPATEDCDPDDQGQGSEPGGVQPNNSRSTDQKSDLDRPETRSPALSPMLSLAQILPNLTTGGSP
jgi:DNA-binding transcriptional MerR regulator